MKYRGHHHAARPFRPLTGLFLLAGLAAVAACNDTGSEPDGALEVTAVSPADGASNIAVTDAIVLTFSQPVDDGTVADAFVLDDAGRAYRGGLALRTENTLAFTPSEPLDFGTSYHVTVKTSLAGRNGSRLSAEFGSTFRTQGAAPAAPVRDSMQRYIRVLADDSMMGRLAGTADELHAARYLAARFEAWGLSPLTGGMIVPLDGLAACGGYSGSRNVLGVVPGSGALASEWVVVGGHYDAKGTEQDSTGAVLVRNGADDNGSGTAMMLELARLFSRAVSNGDMAGVPRRAVLFAGFGAEERGLIGSCEFMHSDVIDPANMAGMVNFDMVGRLRNNTVTTQAGGSADAWDDMLANTNVASLEVDLTTACTYPCSDFYWFGRNDVPYVWFYTGTHNDYHRPTDDEDLINYDGMVAIGSAAWRILTRLAVTPGRPVPAGNVAAGAH
jgi:hypothetical protein